MLFMFALGSKVLLYCIQEKTYILPVVHFLQLMLKLPAGSDF